MPGNKQDKTLLDLLNSTSSAGELLADLGHFSGLGQGSRGGIPSMSNQESLVDPLTNPVVGGSSSGGGQTTEGLLQQLSTQTSVLNGVEGADTSGSGSNSLLSTLTGLLGGGSSGGSLGGLLGGFLGGGISPLISGLADLFGGSGNSAPAPLVPFQMPSSVQFQAGIDGPGGGGLTASDYGENGLPRSAGQAGGSQSSGTQQVTVQVNAMDSKSFLDRSDDIAQAVRQAMLTSNSLNDVIAGV